MEKNQKIMISLLIGVFVILLGFSFFVGKDDSDSSNNQMSEETNSIIDNAQKESDSVKDSEKKELTEIKMDKYIELYEGNESKLILIARPTCHYCQIAEPIIKNIAYENDLEIYYLNTDNFEGDDETKLVQSNEYFSEEFGTPLLLVVKNNEIIDKVDGLTDKSNYIEFFKSNGFIN